MNSYINYLLEANFGLLLFLFLYAVLLRGETNFLSSASTCWAVWWRRHVFRC